MYTMCTYAQHIVDVSCIQLENIGKFEYIIITKVHGKSMWHIQLKMKPIMSSNQILSMSSPNVIQIRISIKLNIIKVIKYNIKNVDDLHKNISKLSMSKLEANL